MTTWVIRYLDTSIGGYMDGTIAFDVTGGTPFEYNSTFVYPRRKSPDVSLGCGPAAAAETPDGSGGADASTDL